jgi:hypothetical protein
MPKGRGDPLKWLWSLEAAETQLVKTVRRVEKGQVVVEVEQGKIIHIRAAEAKALDN